MLNSGISDSLRNFPDRKRGKFQGGVEPELATSSREGPASHGMTLPGVMFRVAIYPDADLQATAQPTGEDKAQAQRPAPSVAETMREKLKTTAGHAVY